MQKSHWLLEWQAGKPYRLQGRTDKQDVVSLTLVTKTNKSKTLQSLQQGILSQEYIIVKLSKHSISQKNLILGSTLNLDF